MRKLLLPLLAVLFLTACEKEETNDLRSDEVEYNKDSFAKGKKGKVDICHKGNIINVNLNSVSAHRAHGDAVDMDGDGFFDIDNSCSATDCDDDSFDTGSLPTLSNTGRFSTRTVTYNSFSINGDNSGNYTFQTGQTVSINLHWTNRYTTPYCPGCITQYYIGLGGDGLSESCLYNGGSSYTFSRNSTRSVVLPSTPGIYPVRMWFSFQYSCVNINGGLGDISCDANTNGIIAFINVVE